MNSNDVEANKFIEAKQFILEVIYDSPEILKDHYYALMGYL